MRGADGHLGRTRRLLLSALAVAAVVIAPGTAAAGVSWGPATPVPAAAPPANPPPPGFNRDGGNWSGYVVTGTDFRSVSARWTEPAVTCGGGAKAFSPWVGIDGYGSPTVQQTGVATDCSSGKPVYRAWYETVPEPPVYYPLPVQAGDVITARVTRSGDRYTMTIGNETRNWSKSTVRTHPGAAVSAEVALEAQEGGFPDFGSVTFSGATVNGRPLGSSGAFAIDSTDGSGFLTRTGPVSGGGFTIRHLRE